MTFLAYLFAFVTALFLSAWALMQSVAVLSNRAVVLGTLGYGDALSIVFVCELATVVIAVVVGIINAVFGD
jgi:hypothetical protein